jgi:hypothetical protein
MTIDELIVDFQYQHGQKMEEFEKMNEELSNPVLNPYGVTKIDFSQRENLRTEIIKLEGAIEGLELYNQLNSTSAEDAE